MERRDFIKFVCLTCTGSIGTAGFLSSCTPQKLITNVTITDNKYVVKKSEFTVTKKDKITQRKFIVISPESSQFPIAIYKLNENEYQALYLQCTHQGCELSPHETVLVCPCHGAEFNPKGEVITGPAETNLKSLSIALDNENIYIQL